MTSSKIPLMEGRELDLSFAECVLGHVVCRGTAGLYERWRQGGKTRTRRLDQYHWHFASVDYPVRNRWGAYEVRLLSGTYYAEVDNCTAEGVSAAEALARAAIMATHKDPTPTAGSARANGEAI